MIEGRVDLQLDRDQELYAKWITARVQLERDMISIFGNPDLPVSILNNMEFQRNLLDHMIPVGIQRSSRWGLREVAVGAANMLVMILDEIEGEQHVS